MFLDWKVKCSFSMFSIEKRFLFFLSRFQASLPKNHVGIVLEYTACHGHLTDRSRAPTVFFSEEMSRIALPLSCLDNFGVPRCDTDSAFKIRETAMGLIGGNFVLKFRAR